MGDSLFGWFFFRISPQFLSKTYQICYGLFFFELLAKKKFKNILLVSGYIKLSPSFQYVNFKNYTSTKPIFVKINNIDRYADKNLPEKK